MFEGELAQAAELATPAIEKPVTATVEDDEGFLPQVEDESRAELEEANEDEAEGEETEEESGEPETAEVELNGKTYKVPAALKDAFLMHKDYTQKSQVNAEIKKAAEAKLAEAESVFNVSNEVLEARAALLNVDKHLKQYDGVNWSDYDPNDPIAELEMQRHYRVFQQLKEARGEITGFLNEEQSKRAATAEQETANRLRETAEFARTKIPGWSPEVDAKVTAFAEAELGFTRDTLKSAYSPSVYKALHLAWLGHQSLQKQNAQPKAPAAPTKPLGKVTPRANPVAGLDDRLSMDEWIKQRNEKARR